MAKLMILGGLHTQPRRTLDIPEDKGKKRDIGQFPFPHDIFSMGRNG